MKMQESSQVSYNKTFVNQISLAVVINRLFGIPLQSICVVSMIAAAISGKPYPVTCEELCRRMMGNSEEDEDADSASPMENIPLRVEPPLKFPNLKYKFSHYFYFQLLLCNSVM
jgi:hypothetical protein